MKRKIIRVEKFLNEMDAIVPWDEIVSMLKPYYKSTAGRRPYDLELMLRIYFLQLWKNLSDPAVEDAIYDSDAYKKFLGFDCFGGKVPDESSICRFRHLLEKHKLSKKILNVVNDYLASRGLILKAGTVTSINQQEKLK